jgi:hypothetical protein
MHQYWPFLVELLFVEKIVYVYWDISNVLEISSKLKLGRSASCVAKARMYIRVHWRYPRFAPWVLPHASGLSFRGLLSVEWC